MSVYIGNGDTASTETKTCKTINSVKATTRQLVKINHKIVINCSKKFFVKTKHFVLMERFILSFLLQIILKLSSYTIICRVKHMQTMVFFLQSETLVVNSCCSSNFTVNIISGKHRRGSDANIYKMLFLKTVSFYF